MMNRIMLPPVAWLKSVKRYPTSHSAPDVPSEATTSNKVQPRLQHLPTERASGFMRPSSCGQMVYRLYSILNGQPTEELALRRRLHLPDDPLQPLRSCPEKLLPLRVNELQDVFRCSESRKEVGCLRGENRLFAKVRRPAMDKFLPFPPLSLLITLSTRNRKSTFLSLEADNGSSRYLIGNAALLAGRYPPNRLNGKKGNKFFFHKTFRYQSQLQKNLLYLAAIADAQPQTAVSRPQMVPPGASPGVGQYMSQVPMFPPRTPLTPQQMQEQQLQQQQAQLLNFSSQMVGRPGMVNGMPQSLQAQPPAAVSRQDAGGAASEPSGTESHRSTGGDNDAGSD
ncbi:hypothetical protein U9M48_036588 [Paspalum notatum var. saurae]|uniref:Uncharacterized protein n=1 Tax=Paspalum notatum var. saurae TaxID=547442 RepID=A0AAQ3UHH1_PASNO